MASTTGARSRAAVRAARSAPTADLRTAAGGMHKEDPLRRRLLNMAGPGRCPQIAAALSQRSTIGAAAQPAALARWRPPALCRAEPRPARPATAQQPIEDPRCPAGSAGWAVRDVLGDAATRAEVARSAGGPAGGRSQSDAANAARSAACPKAVALRLAQHPGHDVRVALMDTPDRPMAALACLTCYGDPGLQGHVARYPQCSPGLLAVLATQPRLEVRDHVAGHPRCPTRVLERFATDQDEDVRCLAAQHRRTPPAALEGLARDASEYVRLEVAENPAAPTRALERLARDGNPYGELDIRRAVAANPRCPGDVLDTLTSLGGAVTLAVCANPATSAQTLTRLAASVGHLLELREIAANPSCPGDVLSDMSRSAHMELRRAVAAQHACPQPILARLADDPSEAVRETAEATLRDRARSDA